MEIVRQHLGWASGDRPRLDLVAEAALCVVPSMALVATGRIQAGSALLHALLVLLLGTHLFRRDDKGYLTLLICVLPAAMLLRGFFIYSLILPIQAAGLVFWAMAHPGDLRSLFRHPALIALLALSAVYWWLSYLETGVYSSNMRILEMAFSAASVVVLGRSRDALGTAVIGIWISVLAVGLALAPYGDRLGMAVIDGKFLGNPIEVGLLSCLLVLLATIEGGRWAGLRRAAFWRVAMIATAAACLILSTSRGSWLVALAGFLVCFVFVPQQRKPLAAMALLVATVVSVLAASGHAEAALHYFDKATAGEKTLSERTTGRADQWMIIPEVMAESPVWGHGPGQGRVTLVRFGGRNLDFHSLYLQVAAETGLAGLAVLAAILLPLVATAYRYFRFTQEIVPLVGITGFLVIGLTVSGFDAMSGLYLGLGLLSLDLAGVKSYRRVLVNPAAIPAASGATPLAASRRLVHATLARRYRYARR